MAFDLTVGLVGQGLHDLFFRSEGKWKAEKRPPAGGRYTVDGLTTKTRLALATPATGPFASAATYGVPITDVHTIDPSTGEKVIISARAMVRKVERGLTWQETIDAYPSHVTRTGEFPIGPVAVTPTPEMAPAPTYGYPPEATSGPTEGTMAITSPLSILGGLGEFVGSLGNVAMQTAPLWSGYLPTPGASGPSAMPGGAVYAPSVTPALGIPGVDLAPPGSTPITPYRTSGRARLPSTVNVPYPNGDGTVRYAHYKNMGRALLYSGDLAACKRVRRVARKAKSRSGGR